MAEKLITYIKSIRWFEIAIRMGAPFLAMLIAIPVINTANIIKMIHALIAFFFGWAHGYTFNEWGGYAGDRYDPSKANRPLLLGKISPREILMFSIILASICAILYYFLEPTLLVIVLLSLCIGILYNHPRITLKKVPFASLLVLFIVSINDTLLGWLVFSNVFFQGLLIGIFFGLLGFAGISYHETGDYESDVKAGIKTNAVRFGKTRIFILAFVFYTASGIYFILLTFLNIIPARLFPAFLLSYPLYVYFFYKCIKSNMDSPAIHLFIKQYRMLYGLIGLYMITRLLTAYY